MPLFFAVFATVDFFGLIGKKEDMGQFLLDGCDASRIPAFHDVVDFPGENQFFFGYDLAVLYDVDGNVMIDDRKDIQIQEIDVAFNLQDILFPHFVAAGVFDDGNTAVQLIQMKILINLHTLSGFNMI